MADYVTYHTVLRVGPHCLSRVSQCSFKALILLPVYALRFINLLLFMWTSGSLLPLCCPAPCHWEHWWTGVRVSSFLVWGVHPEAELREHRVVTFCSVTTEAAPFLSPTTCRKDSVSAHRCQHLLFPFCKYLLSYTCSPFMYLLCRNVKVLHSGFSWFVCSFVVQLHEFFLCSVC